MRTPPYGPEWEVLPRPGQTRTDAEREQWWRDMTTAESEHGDPRDARADRSER